MSNPLDELPDGVFLEAAAMQAAEDGAPEVAERLRAIAGRLAARPAPVSVEALRAIVEPLRKLEAKASPAPWAHCCDEDPPDSAIESDGGLVASVHHHANVRTILRHGEEFSHTDARLIALMRNALPALLALLSRTEGEGGD